MSIRGRFFKGHRGWLVGTRIRHAYTMVEGVFFFWQLHYDVFNKGGRVTNSKKQPQTDWARREACRLNEHIDTHTQTNKTHTVDTERPSQHIVNASIKFQTHNTTCARTYILTTEIKTKGAETIPIHLRSQSSHNIPIRNAQEPVLK